jgi:hypothetical protein
MDTEIKMDELKLLTVDAASGESFERELNQEEIAELSELKDQATIQQENEEIKAAARTSALAKLADLGLTAEEIAAL